jgi:hypothetical protein
VLIENGLSWAMEREGFETLDPGNMRAVGKKAK